MLLRGRRLLPRPQTRAPAHPVAPVGGRREPPCCRTIGMGLARPVRMLVGAPRRPDIPREDVTRLPCQGAGAEGPGSGSRLRPRCGAVLTPELSRDSRHTCESVPGSQRRQSDRLLHTSREFRSDTITSAATTSHGPTGQVYRFTAPLDHRSSTASGRRRIGSSISPGSGARRALRHCGCRSAIRSAEQRVVRSGLPCRWPARAGSRGRSRGRPWRWHRPP